VFHGTEALCLPRDTKSVDASNPKWNEVLTFDLDLRDIPRSARICITLCSLPKKSRVRVRSIGLLTISV
jgi:phosphatidylinositol-4,5-bisphosphate 3-kinase